VDGEPGESADDHRQQTSDGYHQGHGKGPENAERVDALVVDVEAGVDGRGGGRGLHCEFLPQSGSFRANSPEQKPNA